MSDRSINKGRLSDDLIAQIRDRTDIVEVIGRYVQLRRAGVNMKGLCPFHEEKTPSFNVNPTRQFFHCFGCQASGDVIAFLMRLEGQGFAEVIEELAQRAGIELAREGIEQSAAAAAERSERQRARELNQRVAQFYRRCLMAPTGQVARDYLERRGLGEAVAEDFGLGFASAKGSALVERLIAEGIDLAFAAQIGLVAPQRSGTGYRDRFWNRLIFPLLAPGGDVLGFGGRLLEPTSATPASQSKAPKYLNSPETILYHKSDVLYGLAQASTTIRKLDTALLVEGNIDVVQLHQHGFKHAVAPMGTALTPQQTKVLARFGKAVVVLFDGDAAGKAAAKKSVGTLLDGGLEVKIATLPEGADPDSLLRERGPQVMQQVLEQAEPAVDFVLREARQAGDDTIPARARVLELVAPVVALLPSRVAQDLYVDRMSMELQLDRATVARAVRQGAHVAVSGRSAPSRETKTGTMAEAGRPAQGKGGPAAASRARSLSHIEVELLKLILEHPLLLTRAEHAHLSMLLTKEELRATYAAAVAMQRERGSVDAAALLREASPEIRDDVARAASASDYAADGDPTRALDDCVVALAVFRLERMVQVVTRRMRKAAGPQAIKASPPTEDPAHGDDKHTLMGLIKLQSQLRQARAERAAEKIWALVPQLVRAEREIHETQ